MRRTSIIASLAAAAFAAAAPAATAHVQVNPSVAAPGDSVMFEVLVPNEGESATTEVSLKFPAGVLPFSFEDTPGWKRTIEEGSDGGVSVVRWTGELPLQGFVRFAFLAGTPEKEGDIAWKATQKYADGEEVAWIGGPGSDEPAAVTRIASTVPRANAGGEGEAAEPADDAAPAEDAAPAAPAAGSGKDGDDEDDEDRDVLALGLGGAGLVFGLAALVLVLSRRHRTA